MKTWYYGICDKCGEGRVVMVNGPIHSFSYLEGTDTVIREFLVIHSRCNLRIVSDDQDMDKLYNDGWERYDKSEHYLQKLYSLPKQDREKFETDCRCLMKKVI